MVGSCRIIGWVEVLVIIGFVIKGIYGKGILLVIYFFVVVDRDFWVRWSLSKIYFKYVIFKIFFTFEFMVEFINFVSEVC